MKILVTGCAGFIGFHITRRLLANGHSVMGVDNLNDYYSPELKRARLRELGIDTSAIKYNVAVSGAEGFTFVQADIEDDGFYERHLSGGWTGYVCHLAAQAGVRYSIENPAQYISSNIVGFFKILEFCRHNVVRRLVYASSSSVYGNIPAMPYREDGCTDRPESLYAATKKSNEVMAYSYASLYSMDIVGLRFFTVYGPWGRPDMAIWKFTKAILEGEQLDLYNDGMSLRDFTYIDDVVDVLYKVLLDAPRGTNIIYNVGCSNPIWVCNLVTEIEKATGRKANQNYMLLQRGDMIATHANIAKAKKEFGWEPKTLIPQGIRAFVDWYIEYTKNTAG